MSQTCELFSTEYRRQFTEKKQRPAERFDQRDHFAERLEEGQIDPRLASIPTQLDEAAEEFVHKYDLDNQRTVYQVTYKDPWALKIGENIERGTPEEGKGEETRKDIKSELKTYIHKTYFDPHEEEILAPPVTTKRILGYIRPTFLHGNLSMYQDTYGRTGGMVMLRNK